jgi:hypothetical protein
MKIQFAKIMNGQKMLVTVENEDENVCMYNTLAFSKEDKCVCWSTDIRYRNQIWKEKFVYNKRMC